MIRSIQILAGFLALATLAICPPEAQIGAANAASGVSPELEYIPHDAAFFVHGNAAKLWTNPIFKMLRAADVKTFEELIGSVKKMFGSSPDNLKSVTLFWPKFKTPPDTASMGIVLVFNDPYDKALLKAGFDQLVGKGIKTTLVTPSDKMAVLLANLDAATYGKPAPTKEGPLSAAIREAATEKHLLVAGSTLASLPDEFRRDDLPPEARAFEPLIRAEAITAFVDLDKEFTVDVRVKASTPPRAKEAEKTLGYLANLAREFIGEGVKDIARDSDKDPALKDIATILTALQAGLKTAKFSSDGETARAVASMKTELPFATAYVAAKRKVQEAAVRAQAGNNLKQIVLGLISYADAMGSMPPAAVCNKTGKPLLSWRVLILPYLDQNDLYKQFKLDEAWDSDHNKTLIAKMPKVYAMPLPSTAKANETYYRAFVGNGAALDLLTGPKYPADFADGTSNTVLVVTAKDAVPWSKPDDLAFDPDKDMTKLLGFFHGDLCMVGMADGSARGLSKKISKTTLHGAITRNGGEVLGSDF
jgi:hypothetical protein